MESQLSDNVVMKKCDSLEAAQQRAGAEVANTGSTSFPVVVFRQGNRWNMTAALPMSWIRNRLESRSASPRSTMQQAQTALNRPEDPKHSETIANYILQNFKKRYVIPPVTLNIQHKVNLYTVDYQSEFLPGYLVIPATARLAITDGQHRKSGITKALDQMIEEDAAELGGDSVAAMITCETDADQIHQDFADCSKTKALPPSLLAVYDRRNPANRLVADLEKGCPLFKSRIDSTSKTLSKKSTYLFLANQLRQLVKELLAGSYALADVDFSKRAEELLSADRQYNDALQKYSAYINHLTNVIPVWEEIAKLPPATLEASQIPVKRTEGWVCLTATGLNLIGRVGYNLFTRGERNWKSYADKLGKVDWKRDAAMWQGNIIQGNKLLTQQAPLKNAYEQICQVIGIPAVVTVPGASSTVIASQGFGNGSRTAGA